jgi:2-iminobutanoate/2-iminopropanoate deaminase
METVPHTPEEIYAPTGPFVHGLEVRGAERLLFLTGTMGLDRHGVPPPTLDEQLVLVWSNIRAILASAGMTVDNIVKVTSYLREAAYAEPNAAARVEALGGRLVPATAVVVGTLDERWLIEIDVTAAG